jgi:zinc D-Ala-D-Ala dipeptidase
MRLLFLFVLILIARLKIYSQTDCTYPAVNSISAYKDSVAINANNKLVLVKKYIPNIELDIRYATTNNFTKKKLYKSADVFLGYAPALALKNVQDSLNKLGLGLKIFDAYRPYAATCLMWQLVKDDRYAANPKNGSGHNRGIAVDLTLINLATKQELAMPTGFDNFSDTSHHNFINLSPQIITNRTLLSNVMEHFGFKKLDTEWWHYYFITAQKPPVFNLSFKQLKKQK